MSRIRTVLAWLLLLAIPLQGIAAASMLYCGPAARAAVQLQQASAGEHHHMQAADHAGHAGPTGSHHAGKAAGGALPDAGHKCGICAACCHSVGLTETPLAVALAPAPQLAWEEPFVPVHSRPSPVPDKPPRA